MLPTLNKTFLRLFQIHSQIQSILTNLKEETTYLIKPRKRSLQSQNHIGNDGMLDCISSLKLLLSAIQTEIDQLEKTGCMLSNLKKGLISWPHKHNKKEILLSWKYGEKTIKYWHEPNNKINNRKPLSELTQHKQTTTPL